MVFAGVEFPCPQLSTFCRKTPTWVPPKDSSFLGPQFLNSQITLFVKSFSSKKPPAGVCRNDSERSFTASYPINSVGLSPDDALSVSEESPSGVCRNDSEQSFTASYLINSVGLPSEDALSVSEESPSDVCRNDSEQFFTASYLIDSCGLSTEAALSVSKKLRIKSPENADAVLELLRKYGFTDAHISRLVVRHPRFLLSSPEKTLLPKLEFFCSIGVPVPVLATKLSVYPEILTCSLENYLIPLYNWLRSVVKSDRKVVHVFSRAPSVFLSAPAKIAFLRQQGLPESSIASLLRQNPTVLSHSEEKIAASIEWASEFGFDKTKVGLSRAIRVFGAMNDSTLKRKMEVYRRCGWSEYDIKTAFLKDPICMKYSETKIMANMDFLVNDMGLKPAAVAHRPSFLSYSVDKRMKPRYLVARILHVMKLKKMVGVASLFSFSEKTFLKNYIVHYQNDVPQLMDIYEGKLSLSEMGFSQDVVEKILNFKLYVTDS